MDVLFGQRSERFENGQQVLARLLQERCTTIFLVANFEAEFIQGQFELLDLHLLGSSAERREFTQQRADDCKKMEALRLSVRNQ